MLTPVVRWENFWLRILLSCGSAVCRHRISVRSIFFAVSALPAGSTPSSTQVVTLLHDEGLVSLNVQYIDGTKIESSANKYTFVWKGSTEKNKVKLETKVKAVLEAAEDVLSIENSENSRILLRKN